MAANEYNTPDMSAPLGNDSTGATADPSPVRGEQPGRGDDLLSSQVVAFPEVIDNVVQEDEYVGRGDELVEGSPGSEQVPTNTGHKTWAFDDQINSALAEGLKTIWMDLRKDITNIMEDMRDIKEQMSIMRDTLEHVEGAFPAPVSAEDKQDIMPLVHEDMLANTQLLRELAAGVDSLKEDIADLKNQGVTAAWDSVRSAGEGDSADVVEEEQSLEEEDVIATCEYMPSRGKRQGQMCGKPAVSNEAPYCSNCISSYVKVRKKLESMGIDWESIPKTRGRKGGKGGKAASKKKKAKEQSEEEENVDRIRASHFMQMEDVFVSEEMSYILTGSEDNLIAIGKLDSESKLIPLEKEDIKLLSNMSLQVDTTNEGIRALQQRMDRIMEAKLKSGRPVRQGAVEAAEKMCIIQAVENGELPDEILGEEYPDEGSGAEDVSEEPATLENSSEEDSYEEDGFVERDDLDEEGSVSFEVSDLEEEEEGEDLEEDVEDLEASDLEEDGDADEDDNEDDDNSGEISIDSATDE